MRRELPKNEFEALYKSVCGVINDAIDNGSESEEIEEDISGFLQEWDTNIHVIEEKSKNSLTLCGWPMIPIN